MIEGNASKNRSKLFQPSQTNQVVWCVKTSKILCNTFLKCEIFLNPLFHYFSGIFCTFMLCKCYWILFNHFLNLIKVWHYKLHVSLSDFQKAGSYLYELVLSFSNKINYLYCLVCYETMDRKNFHFECKLSCKVVWKETFLTIYQSS